MIMVVAPADIIRLMYEHGEFTAENTALTAPVLAAFALGIAAWCVQPVIMRAYFALQRPVPPIIMGTIATAIFLGVSYGVVSSKSNYTLLPLAGSAAAIALAIILIVMIRRDVDGLDIGGLIKTFALSVLASFGAAGVFWCGMRGLDFIGFTRNKVGVIIGCLVLGFIAAGIYYLLSRALKMPESDYLDRALNKRKGGGSGPSNPPPATPAAE
jgi:putative peptidoglycan lipid II flippase